VRLLRFKVEAMPVFSKLYIEISITTRAMSAIRTSGEVMFADWADPVIYRKDNKA
jgi:hypothetical protein